MPSSARTASPRLGHRHVDVQRERRLAAGQLAHRRVQILVARAGRDLDLLGARERVRAGHRGRQAERRGTVSASAARRWRSCDGRAAPTVACGSVASSSAQPVRLAARVRGQCGGQRRRARPRSARPARRPARAASPPPRARRSTAVRPRASGPMRGGSPCDPAWRTGERFPFARRSRPARLPVPTGTRTARLSSPGATADRGLRRRRVLDGARQPAARRRTSSLCRRKRPRVCFVPLGVGRRRPLRGALLPPLPQRHLRADATSRCSGATAGRATSASTCWRRTSCTSAAARSSACSASGARTGSTRTCARRGGAAWCCAASRAGSLCWFAERPDRLPPRPAAL